MKFSNITQRRIPNLSLENVSKDLQFMWPLLCWKGTRNTYFDQKMSKHIKVAILGAPADKKVEETKSNFKKRKQKLKLKKKLEKVDEKIKSGNYKKIGKSWWKIKSGNGDLGGARHSASLTPTPSRFVKILFYSSPSFPHKFYSVHAQCPSSHPHHRGLIVVLVISHHRGLSTFTIFSSQFLVFTIKVCQIEFQNSHGHILILICSMHPF